MRGYTAMIRTCRSRTDVCAPFNVDGGIMFRDIRPLLYLGESFILLEPRTNSRCFHTPDVQGCFEGLHASKRLPLAEKYCIHRWAT